MNTKNQALRIQKKELGFLGELKQVGTNSIVRVGIIFPWLKPVFHLLVYLLSFAHQCSAFRYILLDDGH